MTVKIGGKTLTATGVTDTAADLGFVTLDKSYEIKDADVKVTVTPKLAALTASSIAAKGNGVYVITYNTDIASVVSTGLVANTDVKAEDSGSTSPIADNSVLAATISGNTLTVTLQKDLTTGQKLIIDNTKIGNKADTSNTLSSTTTFTAPAAGSSWTVA